MSVQCPPQVQRMLGEATIRYAYREFQQAVRLLVEIVRLCPGLPHPYQTLGLMYEEMDRRIAQEKIDEENKRLAKLKQDEERRAAGLPPIVPPKRCPYAEAADNWMD